MAVNVSHQLKNVQLSSLRKLLSAFSYKWFQHESSCEFCNTSCDESNSNGKKSVNEMSSKPELPEEPTNCCMSGCANCVWIQYAEELIQGFDGGSDLARRIILDKVEDPNMKAFLEMELRTLDKQ